MSGQLQVATWRFLVAHDGRAVPTDIAAALGVTREHLSRAFSAGGSANLKRIIASLDRLRGIDLIERFVKGRTRSRG